MSISYTLFSENCSKNKSCQQQTPAIAFQSFTYYSLPWNYLRSCRLLDAAHSKVILLCAVLTVPVTIVSWISTHGRLNITRNFGPHGRLFRIKLPHIQGPLKCGTYMGTYIREWALAKDTMVNAYA